MQLQSLYTLVLGGGEEGAGTIASAGPHA